MTFRFESRIPEADFFVLLVQTWGLCDQLEGTQDWSDDLGEDEGDLDEGGGVGLIGSSSTEYSLSSLSSPSPSTSDIDTSSANGHR